LRVVVVVVVLLLVAAAVVMLWDGVQAMLLERSFYENAIP
jgi:hypothetical protein